MQRFKLFFVFVVAISTMSCGNDSQSKCFQYVFDDGNAIVSGFTPMPKIDSTHIVVPDMVECDGHTYQVIKIGERAFKDCKYITSISLPESVQEIGDSAFWKCSALKEINIPKAITKIGPDAFHDTKGLTIHITDIEAWCNIAKDPRAFDRDYDLYIDGGIVNNLTIPESVTNIKNYAFAGCTSLTSVTIPNSVTSIGGGAFAYCSSLTSIEIPNKIDTINGETFYGARLLEHVVIPSSVKKIVGSAFMYCENLSVTCKASIPPTYGSEGSLALYISGSNLDTLSLYALSLYVPAGSIDAYKNAPVWRDFKYINAISE